MRIDNEKDVDKTKGDDDNNNANDVVVSSPGGCEDEPSRANANNESEPVAPPEVLDTVESRISAKNVIFGLASSDTSAPTNSSGGGGRAPQQQSVHSGEVVVTDTQQKGQHSNSVLSTKKDATSNPLLPCVGIPGETPEDAPSTNNPTTNVGTLPTTGGEGVPGAYHHSASGHMRATGGGGDDESTDSVSPSNTATERSNPGGLLATASLVLSNDENIPTAVRHVPGTTIRENPRMMRKILLVGTAVCLVLAVGAVIGSVLTAAVGSSNNQGKDSHNPDMTLVSSTGRTEQEKDDIRSIISSRMDISYTTAKSSSWIRAMEWILDDDPLQVSATDDTHLLQRFWLAYFYFSTTEEGQHQWSSCNPLDDDDDEEEEQDAETTKNITTTTTTTDHLCYYQQHTGGGIWDMVHAYHHWRSNQHEMIAARWLMGQHECQWAGVYCNDQRNVEMLQLDFMNLTGTVPDTGLSAALSDLRSISLSDNNLYGNLPSSVADLPNLTFLNFQRNDFGGTVPDAWWKSEHMKKNVQTITLRYLPLSSYTLPPDIGDLTKLENLVLDGTGLTGTIPLELYQLTQLEFLTMLNNRITGTLATEVGLLSNLFALGLNGNTLMSGTLPSEVAQLTKVAELGFWDVPFRGTIPEDLYLANWESLNAIILSGSQISGTISTSVGRLSTLGYLLLSRNNLTGRIPSELGLCKNLWKITVDATGLQGPMPQEVCNLRGDQGLGRIKADCEELSNGTTPMECPVGCCTNCCNIETGICTKTGF